MANIPMTADQIRAGFNNANPGFTVRVIWAYEDRAETVYTWYGRFLGMVNNQANVFYWRGQQGFPQLEDNQAGIEVLMPRDGVVYHNLQVTQAIPVTAAQLRAAQDRELAQEEGDQTLSVADSPSDVSRWTITCHQDARIIVMEAAVFTGFTATCPSQRVHQAWNIFRHWTDTAAEIQGWQDIAPIVALGNDAFRGVRQAIAEEVLNVRPQDLASKMNEEDYAADPFGKALAQCRTRGRGGRGGGGRSSGGRFNCDRCGSKSHTTDRCYSRRVLASFAGNAKGTGQK